MIEKRLDYIDFLKFIGLTAIIIAHVNSPDWLMILRNFDVPLMVIISSILASHSIKKYKNDKNSIINYYISRIKRLVFPTWIFLIFYFIFRLIVTHEIMRPIFYIASFLLTRYGLGYVWVILIYLYSSFLIPIYRKIGYCFKISFLILFIYLIFELFFYLEIGVSNKIIDTTFYYIIPYGLLTYIGYNYEKMKMINKNIITLISFMLFFIIFIFLLLETGTIQNVQVAKYPPRLYYLSYGVFCSFSLLLFCQKYNFKLYNNKLIKYISVHSLWIYLWHILIIDFYELLHLPDVWYLKFIIIYVLSIVIVAVKNIILDKIEKKHNYTVIKYLRG